jgi:AAA15 family ATPase/GTPase
MVCFMIEEFKVQNFFSIRSEQMINFRCSSDTFMSEEYCVEVKPGLKLLKLGIVYGANASGKSNLLHAIEFFKYMVCNAPKDRSSIIKVIPFKLDDNSCNKHTIMSMTFYINGEKYILNMEFDDSRFYEESLIVYTSPKGTTLYSRSYNNETDSSLITFSSKLGLMKKSQDVIIGNTLNNRSVLAAFSVSNIESSKLNDVYSYFSNHIPDVLEPNMILSSYIKRKLELDKDGSLKNFLLKFLKASDFNIKNFELSDEEMPITQEMEKVIQSSPLSDEKKAQMMQKGTIKSSNINFVHTTDDGDHNLPEEYESRGTIRFMGMSVILKQLLKDGHFVMMDEVESSIHYELLSYFLKVFLVNSNKESQLFVTTHDVNLLNEDFIRRDCILFTEKNGAGETIVKRLSGMGLHKNLSPYNAYKQGKLIDLPFLGSPYFSLNDDCL